MDNNNKNKDPNHNRQGWGIILATTLLVTFIVMGLYSMMQGSGPEEISYDKFLSLIDEGEVQEVSLNSDRIYITLTDEARREELEETGRTGNPGNVLSQLQDQMQGQMQSGGGTEEESERSPDYYTGYVNDYTLTDKLEKEKREELAEAERKRQTQEKEMTELIKNQGRVISGMLQMMREFGSKLGEDVSPLNEEEFGRHMADQNPWVILECMKKIFEAVNKQ